MQRAIAVLAMFMAAISFTASAAYPDRPIRIIVPFPPGAGNDLLARILGQKLSAAVGQSVIVENRAGAGGNIGTQIAARAAPDGYTLLVINNAQTMNAALSPNLPFDVIADFAPVSMVVTSPMLLVAANTFPARTVQELIATAKAHPGRVNYGSSGYGTPQHFGFEMLEAMSGAKLTHVPYRGQAPSNAALLSNEIQVAFGTVAGFAPLIRAGRIRPIASAGLTPPKEFPNLPTVAQSGFPGFNLFIWYGLVAPAATPSPIVKRLNDELLKILADPANRKELEDRGFEITPQATEEFAAFMKTDLAQWQALVKRAHLLPPDSGTQ